MPYISSDIIVKAREIDALTYLKEFEPEELVQLSGSVYSLKSHDSLKLSNGKWMWWSRGIGGNNAIDFLTKVKGLSFVEAVTAIMGNGAVSNRYYCSKPPPEKEKQLILPQKSKSNAKAIEYLTGRGIDREIVESLVESGLIYASQPYNNVVFVGVDSENIPRYAAYRSTNNRRYLGDCEGSDKRFSFRLMGGNTEEIHLFESAIDLLSYATLIKMKSGKWQDLNLISLGGVGTGQGKITKPKVPLAIIKCLEESKNLKTIWLHFDNDNAGKVASLALKKLLSDRYEVVDLPAPKGKDINDYLCYKKGIKALEKEKTR